MDSSSSDTGSFSNGMYMLFQDEGEEKQVKPKKPIAQSNILIWMFVIFIGMTGIAISFIMVIPSIEALKWSGTRCCLDYTVIENINNGSCHTKYRVNMTISYSTHIGKVFKQKQFITSKVEPDEYNCWYLKSDPNTVTNETFNSSPVTMIVIMTIICVLGISFVLIGFIKLITIIC